MDIQFVRDRITQLRLLRNLSEREISLSMGHGGSYIHGIVGGKTLPVQELLNFCDCLDITPCQFFDMMDQEPLPIKKLLSGVANLDDKEFSLVLQLVETLNEYKSKTTSESNQKDKLIIK